MSRGAFLKSIIFCSLLLVGGLVATAAADPVTVRSGGYSDDYGDGASTWEFAGTGFRFEMWVTRASESYIGPFESCHALYDPCTPSVDLSTHVFGIYGNGDSTLHGFPGVYRPAQIGDTSYAALFYSGDFQFDAPTIAPRGGRIEEPFVFSGHLRAFTNPALTGTPVFDSDLKGRGTAMIVLSGPFSGDNSGLYLYALSYTFANDADPTPEPATMLLVGSVLAGGIAGRRRQLRKGDRHA